MNDARAYLLAERERRQRLRAAILDAYEVGVGAAYAVRRLDVVTAVARALGWPVLNNERQREVHAMVEALGGQLIRVHNRRLFRGVKPRTLDNLSAIEHARAQRRERGAKRPMGEGNP